MSTTDEILVKPARAAARDALANIFKPVRPTGDELERALAIIDQDYQADVRAVVIDALEAVERGEITGREGLDEWLSREIEDHGRIICMRQAKLGLFCSSNEDAADDVGGVSDVSERMFWAFRADIEERLEHFNLFGDE